MHFLLSLSALRYLHCLKQGERKAITQGLGFFMATGERKNQERGFDEITLQIKLVGDTEFLCSQYPRVMLSKRSHKSFQNTKFLT